MITHIVLITTSFPEDELGSEIAGSFIADFAEELSNHHVQVTVIAPSLQHREYRHKNFTVKRFRVPSLPLSLLQCGNPMHWIHIIRTIWSGQETLNKIIKEEHIDYVFAFWVLPSGFWARNVFKRYKIPYSTWALGSDIWALSRIPLVKSVLRSVLRDSILCFSDGYVLKGDVERISERSCEFLSSMRKFPITAKKELAVMPPYRLAFLGRWHSNKGIDLLLESLNLLNDADWQRIEEIRIFGGGPLECVVKAGHSSLREHGRAISLGGYLRRNEAAELFAWADYVLLPSRIESIPVVFSDAMQSYCPVVCMPVGDLPRLIEEYEVGQVADDVNAPAFAEAIRSILKQSPKNFEKGLHSVAKTFDLTAVVHHFLNMSQQNLHHYFS